MKLSILLLSTYSFKESIKTRAHHAGPMWVTYYIQVQLQYQSHSLENKSKYSGKKLLILQQQAFNFHPKIQTNAHSIKLYYVLLALETFTCIQLILLIMKNMGWLLSEVFFDLKNLILLQSLSCKLIFKLILYMLIFCRNSVRRMVRRIRNCRIQGTVWGQPWGTLQTQPLNVNSSNTILYNRMKTMGVTNRQLR